ncbi:hypothetical protein GCM10022209_10220 [Chitinophaga oryziterrae]
MYAIDAFFPKQEDLLCQEQKNSTLISKNVTDYEINGAFDDYCTAGGKCRRIFTNSYPFPTQYVSG